MKLLLTAAWVGAMLWAQEPSGVIQGSVRDSIARHPIAGAQVTLGGPVSATASTDSDGAFHFENLPAGVYRLATRAPGYLDSGRGRFADTVRLASPDATAPVAIDLLPLADIEGSVLNEEGQPVAGVAVYIGPDLRSWSDADGRYRLENLVPAGYRIAVHVPYEIRRQTARRDPETGEMSGYAAIQYYPAAYDESAAVPIPVAPGMHVRKLEIRLRRTRLVALGGRLVDTPGKEPVSGAEVELPGFPRQPVDPQGAFRFDLVRPGHYTLLVYRDSGEGRLPYLVPVDAGDRGAGDLTVAVPPFATLQGSVRLAGPAIPWEGELRVSLYGDPGGATQPVTVSGDGTFTLANVPPGQWWLDFEGPGLHVAQVRFGAQDGLRGPLAIAASGNPPVDVTLSNEAGQLTGTVAIGENDPPPVILVRRMEGLHRQSQYVMPSYSPQDGAFAIPGLVPGEYQVSAWTPDPSGTAAINPQLCGSRLATVKIAAGETAVVRLQVCNQ